MRTELHHGHSAHRTFGEQVFVVCFVVAWHAALIATVNVVAFIRKLFARVTGRTASQTEEVFTKTHKHEIDLQAVETETAAAPVLALPAPTVKSAEQSAAILARVIETPDVIALADHSIPEGFNVIAVAEDGTVIVEPNVYLNIHEDISKEDQIDLLMLYGGEGGEGMSRWDAERIVYGDIVEKPPHAMSKEDEILDAAFPPVAVIDAAVREDKAQRRARIAKEAKSVVFTDDAPAAPAEKPARKTKSVTAKVVKDKPAPKAAATPKATPPVTPPKPKGKAKTKREKHAHPEGKFARMHPGCELSM
jgi:hypothetical protein